VSGADPFEGYSLPAERIELGNGDELVVAVGQDGSTSFWLVRADGCGCSGCQGDASRANAPHEQRGLLPEAFRRRVAGPDGRRERRKP
jgi:hypothetical protein